MYVFNPIVARNAILDKWLPPRHWHGNVYRNIESDIYWNTVCSGHWVSCAAGSPISTYMLYKKKKKYRIVSIILPTIQLLVNRAALKISYQNKYINTHIKHIHRETHTHRNTTIVCLYLLISSDWCCNYFRCLLWFRERLNVSDLLKKRLYRSQKYLMKRKRVKLPASGVIVLWFITYYSHTHTHTITHNKRRQNTLWSTLWKTSRCFMLITLCVLNVLNV